MNVKDQGPNSGLRYKSTSRFPFDRGYCLKSLSVLTIFSYLSTKTKLSVHKLKFEHLPVAPVDMK